eukprot:8787933-Alexandrium_andersonii.AAC.1
MPLVEPPQTSSWEGPMGCLLLAMPCCLLRIAWLLPQGRWQIPSQAHGAQPAGPIIEGPRRPHEPTALWPFPGKAKVAQPPLGATYTLVEALSLIHI